MLFTFVKPSKLRFTYRCDGQKHKEESEEYTPGGHCVTMLKTRRNVRRETNGKRGRQKNSGRRCLNEKDRSGREEPNTPEH